MCGSDAWIRTRSEPTAFLYMHIVARRLIELILCGRGNFPGIPRGVRIRHPPTYIVPRAAERTHHDHRKGEGVGLFHRCSPQLIPASRGTDFTAGDAGERRGCQKIGRERHTRRLIPPAPRVMIPL
jgi:hypothetical protein